MIQTAKTNTTSLSWRLGFTPDGPALDDYEFQEKCLARIATFQSQGKILLFVSHAMESIHRFCHRAIGLQKGQLLADGPADEIITAYEGHKQVNL